MMIDRRQDRKRLVRVEEHAFCRGILAGIAFKYEISVTILRFAVASIMLVLFCFAKFDPFNISAYALMGIVVIYFIGRFVIPEAEFDLPEYNSYTRMRWFDK